ncbi:MAG: thiamine phosphate synthase [Nevskiales bacterium]|nr:thiamine phosphate synthase [Nevskiales bacterium]
MNAPHVPRGLYAITSEPICRDERTLLTAVEAACRGGAVLIQYRDKWNEAATRRRYARALADDCRRLQVPLIINDDPQLAADCGAQGVHLGAGDAPLTQARQRLGDRAVIGVSCGNQIERAVAAQVAGASYVSFGRFFDSRTKPGAPAADLALLYEARPHLQVPICVIGGLTPDNAGPPVQAGADLIAAVGGVFAAADIEAAARAYANLFK